MADLTALFNPNSVAVIGASKSPEKIGNAIITNVIQSGYKGEIYPINPKEDEISGYKCYPTVLDIGRPVDMAVISVPTQHVCEVARQCGEIGVKALITITAGFKEVGTEGLKLEKSLVEICKSYGMRMLGPNCLGMMDSHTPINATFAKRSPLQGQIAFISQSGALCVAILDWSLTKGIGFSQFISLGNKADLNEADLIAHAADDPNTKVIACYLEDVTDGKQFIEVARKAALKTPIIVLKAGTTQAGALAASSHTGALAGSDLAYDVAFRQCGVIRAHTMTELFDLAIAFAMQPVAKGPRVAIVTNSGGPGIITTDRVEKLGLEMSRFDKSTIDHLRSTLPKTANVYNPVDVIGDAAPDRYENALETVLRDDNVHSVIVLLTPTAVVQPEVTAEIIARARDRFPEKPVVASFMGGTDVEEATRILFRRSVPCYPFPEPAVSAVRGLVDQGRLAERIVEEPVRYNDVNREAVSELFREVKEEGRLVLLGTETVRVARAYNIPAAPSLLATRADEAAYIAELLGFPVVLKVASPKILHKTDVGGVKVGLDTPAAVRRAFIEIMENVHRFLPGTSVHGVEVQKMMPKGRELIVGMTKDVQFGPLIAFGLGGIYVNLLKDVSFRLASGLSRREMESMISETKASMLLRGFRGEQPADVEALIDVIGRVGQLVTDFPEITEMDINPIFAYEKGVSALDIKITIS